MCFSLIKALQSGSYCPSGGCSLSITPWHFVSHSARELCTSYAGFEVIRPGTPYVHKTGPETVVCLQPLLPSAGVTGGKAPCLPFLLSWIPQAFLPLSLLSVCLSVLGLPAPTPLCFFSICSPPRYLRNLVEVPTLPGQPIRSLWWSQGTLALPTATLPIVLTASMVAAGRASATALLGYALAQIFKNMGPISCTEPPWLLSITPALLNMM